jgi:hypothetical protein
LQGNVLLWERLNVAERTAEVDKRLFCSGVKLDASNFNCGFIKNQMNAKQISDLTPKITTHAKSDAKKEIPLFDNLDTHFCMNVTDCFVSLPYLCEVNCTNQEKKCATWKTGTLL